MKFISTIVLSLLSVTVSAVVIDRPSTSESEPVKECSTQMQQHTGICASTGTEQQSTETNHDVAQSTIDSDDPDNSVEQSDESPSLFELFDFDDDIFDGAPYDGACPLPKKYIPENERPILTPQQRLDRVEQKMRNKGMEIPESVGDGYPHKMNAKTKERILKTKQLGRKRKLSPSDKKKLKRLKLGRLWMCRKLALEPPEEASISVVSEPTPELKSILKTGSTFKPHGSKHDHSKKHQQKSSHDAGSKKAKVRFNPKTKTFEYPRESDTNDEEESQPTQSTSNEDEIQPTQSISNEDEIQSTQSTNDEDETQSTQSTNDEDEIQSTQSTNDEDETQPTQSTNDEDEIQSTQSTQSTNDEDEIQPTQSTNDEDEIQPTQSTSNEDEIQPTQSTSNEDEIQPTQSTNDEDEIQPTQSTNDEDEIQPTQSTNMKKHNNKQKTHSINKQ
ncbi:hypothetical protein QVD99_003256 [Batrachochytrium dendrobatidis]|nr:hypothetical protein QVD99_003256 [Batrachochytrium dendrobatidis]